MFSPEEHGKKVGDIFMEHIVVKGFGGVELKVGQKVAMVARSYGRSYMRMGELVELTLNSAKLKYKKHSYKYRYKDGKYRKIDLGIITRQSRVYNLRSMIVLPDDYEIPVQ